MVMVMVILFNAFLLKNSDILTAQNHPSPYDRLFLIFKTPFPFYARTSFVDDP